MNTQPEALRLADELERDKWHVPAVVMQAAADELRRLSAVEAQRDALLEALREAQACFITQDITRQEYERLYPDAEE